MKDRIFRFDLHTCFRGCGKSQRGTGFRSTATLGCVVFPVLNKGAQPRVAVLPDFFRNLFSLFEQEKNNAQSQAIPEGRGGRFRRDVISRKRRL
jgi:hypothetical protein